MRKNDLFKGISLIQIKAKIVIFGVEPWFMSSANPGIVCLRIYSKLLLWSFRYSSINFFLVSINRACEKSHEQNIADKEEKQVDRGMEDTERVRRREKRGERGVESKE